MKHLKLFLLMLLFVFMIVSSGGAVEISQWELPENAVARVGKGGITDITYSPDGKLVAVGTPIGVWLYDAQTGDESALLSGLTNTELSNYLNLKHKQLNRSPSVAFSPDGKCYWLVGIRKSVCGMWEHGNIKLRL